MLRARLSGTPNACRGRGRHLPCRPPGPLCPCPWARPTSRTARGSGLATLAAGLAWAVGRAPQ
eukprot:1277269-Alexandrium_andersonii.AAC.1